MMFLWSGYYNLWGSRTFLYTFLLTCTIVTNGKYNISNLPGKTQADCKLFRWKEALRMNHYQSDCRLMVPRSHNTENRGGHDHTNKPTTLQRQITSTISGGSYAQPLRLAKMLRSLPEVPDNKLSQPYLNKGPTS